VAPPGPPRLDTRSRNAARIAAVVTIGLVGLVGIAALQAPGRLDGGVLAATGPPATTERPDAGTTPPGTSAPGPGRTPSVDPSLRMP
jgi:hypothetical protein